MKVWLDLLKKDKIAVTPLTPYVDMEMVLFSVNGRFQEMTMALMEVEFAEKQDFLILCRKLMQQCCVKLLLLFRI